MMKASACSTYLHLSISLPALSSSSPSLPSSGEGRELDMNEVPRCGGEKEEEENGPARKKLKLSKEQSRLLEQSFTLNHTLNPKQKEELAEEVKLRPRQVEVWFQNRRARSKLKQTEMECEYMKRWYGSLTEQNRRLQKEVEELRAMKAGESLRVSTLSMCPHCERVSTNTNTNTNDNPVSRRPPCR